MSSVMYMNCSRPFYRSARFCFRPGSFRRPLRVHSSGDLIPRGSGGYFRDIAPRFERMADYFDRVENELFGGMETFLPRLSRDGVTIAMDVREDDEAYTISADLPGMEKKDVTIQVTPERILTISGERQFDHKEEKENFVRNERRFGKFYRSFQLPKNADTENIKAVVEKGVLKVTIKKLEEQSGSARTINID